MTAIILDRCATFSPLGARAPFEIAPATLLALRERQMALVVARCSFGSSRRSCAEILARRGFMEHLGRDLEKRSFTEIALRELL